MGNICIQDTAISSFPIEIVDRIDDTKNIMYGPVKEINIPKDNVGQLWFQTFSKLPPDFELLIEANSDRRITAQETLKQSVGLIAGMKELDIHRLDRICVVAHNSIDVNIVAFASFFMSGVLCPIDPSMKSYEVQHILKIIKPKIIFCDVEAMNVVQDAISKLKMSVPVYALGAEEIDNVSRMESLVKDVPIEGFVPEPCDDAKSDPIVILMSSGTTGLPKCVEIPHYAFSYQACSVASLFTGVALHASFFYWVSGMVILIGASTSGSQRILVNSNDPLTCLKACDKYKTNMVLLSPSVGNEMINHPQLSDFDLSHVEKLMMGGSPILEPTYLKWKEHLPNCAILQGYGATEVTGLMSIAWPGVDPLSLGTLLANIKAKIIDVDSGEALGSEKEGEFVVKSPSAMIRYVGNEKATREAVDNEGWYHTGDICKYTSEGVFYMTGRIKELMKVHNHQIAPVEIEDLISSIDGVADVAVTGIDIDENTLPMALIVKKTESNITAQDVIQYVQENLSEYKQLRAGVFFVESIPRTASGKIKRSEVKKIGEELYHGSHEE